MGWVAVGEVERDSVRLAAEVWEVAALAAAGSAAAAWVAAAWGMEAGMEAALAEA